MAQELEPKAAPTRWRVIDTTAVVLRAVMRISAVAVLRAGVIESGPRTETGWREREMEEEKGEAKQNWRVRGDERGRRYHARPLPITCHREWSNLLTCILVFYFWRRCIYYIVEASGTHWGLKG